MNDICPQIPLPVQNGITWALSPDSQISELLYHRALCSRAAAITWVSQPPIAIWLRPIIALVLNVGSRDPQWVPEGVPKGPQLNDG